MSILQSNESHITINADGASKEVRFQNNGTQNMVLDSSGNVGIGTASPGSALDVTGTVTADDLIADTSYPQIYVKHNGTQLGGLRADATVKLEVKTTGSYPVRIQTNSTDVANFAVGGDVDFYDSTGSNAKFHWDASDESLGIGDESTVRGDLNIYKSANNFSTTQNGDYGSLFLQGGNTNTEESLHGAISFGKGMSAVGRESYKYGAIALVQTSGDMDQNGLAFYVSPNASASSPGTLSEAMRIEANGNVGIGTDSPSGKLDVEDKFCISTSNRSSSQWVNLAGAVDYTASTSSTDIFKLSGTSLNSAEITIVYRDTQYAGGSFIQKIYLSSTGSGAATNNPTIAVENKNRKNAGTWTDYFTWAVSLDGWDVKFSATATVASGNGVIWVKAEGPVLGALTFY